MKLTAEASGSAPRVRPPTAAAAGASTLKAIERVEAAGLRVRCAFALVDRLEGGREAVTQKGYGLSTLFTRSDFLP